MRSRYGDKKAMMRWWWRGIDGDIDGDENEP
jgi:hypothetical protein